MRDARWIYLWQMPPQTMHDAKSNDSGEPR
jgi:hypothetical protein